MIPTHTGQLLAKQPNHIWMIDFTRLKRCIGPIWVGSVIDAYSRRVHDGDRHLPVLRLANAA